MLIMMSFSDPPRPRISMISDVAVPAPSQRRWVKTWCLLYSLISLLPLPRSTMDISRAIRSGVLMTAPP